MKSTLYNFSIMIVFFSQTLCINPKSKLAESPDLHIDLPSNVSLSSDDSILVSIYKKAINLSLPIISDSSNLNWNDVFYLKNLEKRSFIKNGFKIPISYNDSELLVIGKLDFLDNHKYLYVAIESKANGLFGAGYFIVINSENKIVNQILLFSYGLDAPDGYQFEILKNKTIKTREYHILESEKIPPNPYTLKSLGEKCYCKVIDKTYVISNGKGIENSEEPKFEYYIFDGRSFKPFIE